MNLFGLRIRFGRYGICFYTDRFVKLGGLAFGPFVFIRPKYYPDDEGLFQHEMCHTRQWWKGVFTLGILYEWSSLMRELEAYTVQVKCYPESQWQRKINLFAMYLSENYKFSKTLDRQTAADLLHERVFGSGD